MNLKKTRFVAVIGTFLIGFICHFAYDFLPSFFTSIFFPVNESVFEHMKILYSSVLIYGVIDYLILHKFNIKFSNFLLNLFILCFSSVFIYLLIFLPIYYNFGENMFVSISLMLVVYSIVYYIGYLILSNKEYKLSILPIIFICLGYVGFGYLTYNPIKNQIFFDSEHEVYGVYK